MLDRLGVCFSIVSCGLAAAACSQQRSSVDAPDNGGSHSASGGTRASTGGGSQTASGGGTESASGGMPTATGGSASAAGGTVQPASGGSGSTGGSAALTGGRTQTPTGGSAQVSIGGSVSSGGSPSSGGTLSSGGSLTSGGSLASGGSVSSGGVSTGGIQAAGGSLVWPPVSTVGGARATGGISAQGGSTGGSPPAFTTVPIGGTHSGDATFFDPNGNGNCSFGAAVLGMDIAALNNPDYQMAAWCGACADVTGPLGTVRVMIVDRCPECASGDLDLNPEAFVKIANREDGRVTITWNFVACDVSGPVKYHYKEGSSPGWTAVQVLNHRVPIAKLEFSTDGGTTYTQVERLEYNYFVYAAGFGPGNIKVRITGADGQVLVDTLPPPTSDSTITGAKQFQ